MTYFVIFTVEGFFCCHSVTREFPTSQSAHAAATAWSSYTRWNLRKSAIVLETGI
jgi:hypothetical protein